MPRFIAFLAPFTLAATLVLPAAAQDADRTQAAIASADRWLALADAGKGAETWQQAAAVFQGAVTRDAWAAALQAARAPYGTPKSRKLVDASYTTTLPGAPAGEYVVIRYEATYTQRAGVVETLVPMREADGSWKVSGYVIR